jgi:hypothetical protein
MGEATLIEYIHHPKTNHRSRRQTELSAERYTCTSHKKDSWQNPITVITGFGVRLENSQSKDANQITIKRYTTINMQELV